MKSKHFGRFAICAYPDFQLKAWTEGYYVQPRHFVLSVGWVTFTWRLQ